MNTRRCTCECEEDRTTGNVYDADDVDTYIRELVDFVDNLRDTLNTLAAFDQRRIIRDALLTIKDEATNLLERY